jgi:hypothetical protein
MKRSVLLVFMLLFSFSVVSAETVCDLDVSLINQDPYPAVPGDYVKLVFQLDGVDGADCQDITFDLLTDYPIEFNSGESGRRTFERINYLKDFDSNILVPYEVRVHRDALDGANPIEVRVQSKGDPALSRVFDLEVSDVKADFEVYVKDYDYSTRELTLEILNIAAADVEALTLEISKQDTIDIKGAKRQVVGDLDSNEYTTIDFEAIPSDGSFEVDLIYSDTINTRRMVRKTVAFDSSYFTNRIADQTTVGSGTYIFWGVVILLVGWFILRKIRKKKKKRA